MAMILEAFISQLVEILGNLIKEEVVSLWGVKDGIKNLQKVLLMIINVLEDAEGRRIGDKNIDMWLNELRDIMYDADDVIDEYLIEGQKRSGQLLENSQLPSSSLSVPVRCCFPLAYHCQNLAFRHKIGNKIKMINAKLDEIHKDKEKYNLKSSNGTVQRVSQISHATSPLSHNEVVGVQIEEDTRKVVNLLVQNSEGQRHMTFGIVGMGGIGKTTLAQKIFNDEIIKSNFPVRMWVYVSQVFDELNILRAVIRQAGGSYQPEMGTKADLDPILCQLIEGKKFLLVLDDVWNARIWKVLRAALNSCAFGSRVLVTSRDEGVVRQMGAKDSYHVKKLPTEDGWSILYRKVSLNMDAKAKGEVEGLKEIGMKIVEKCGGHPLAIQAIGGVLSMSDASEMKWNEVLDKIGDQTWSLTKSQEGLTEEGEVMNILYLSYQDLPPRLKPCFLYFSLCGEGFKLKNSYIYGLWISEGLIKAERDLSLEEVAEGYYKELIRRNLLQLDPKWYADAGCMMHDLLLSLAKLLTKGENYFGDFQNLGGGTILNDISYRRLCICDEGATVIPKLLKQCKCLRTLILQTPSLRDVCEDIFVKLRRLRVLDLSGSEINNLPKSIKNLVHLRFLDISSTGVEEVPEVIGCLINLQFFFLKSCSNLHSLPRGITKLGNLRCLDFTDSPVNYLPKGIGGLQNLRRLFDFVVGCPHEGSGLSRQVQGGGGRRGSFGSNLRELKNLHQITHLSISKLERISSSEEAREAALREKRHLDFLVLCWTNPHGNGGASHDGYDGEETERIEGVFNQLCPAPNLRRLTIKGFFGPMSSTSWLLDSCGTLLPNLTRLDLEDCVNCRRLPPLGRLPQLDYLYIKGASAVVTISPELMMSGDLHDGGGGGVLFPKLKKLIIEDMPNWEEWCFGVVQAGALPRLEILQIGNCPKLRSLPDDLLSHATNLTTLNLNGLHCISAVENLGHVKDVYISDCPRLEVVSNLPAMESLLIEDCPLLEVVPNSLGALRHLTLSLGGWEGMLPEWLQYDKLGALQKLEIYCSFQLLKKLLPKAPVNGEDEEDGTEWRKIRHIPHVYAEDRRVGSSYYFSYTEHPYTFNTNIP